VDKDTDTHESRQPAQSAPGATVGPVSLPGDRTIIVLVPTGGAGDIDILLHSSGPHSLLGRSWSVVARSGVRRSLAGDKYKVVELAENGSRSPAETPSLKSSAARCIADCLVKRDLAVSTIDALQRHYGIDTLTHAELDARERVPVDADPDGGA
jgi:hypothetical protein